MHDPLPRRHSRQLGAVLVDGVPVELAAVEVDVDVARAQPRLALPGEADEPEEHDDGEGEVRLEEARGVVEAALGRADGDIELFFFCWQGSELLALRRKRGGDTYLSNQHEHDQRQAKVATVDTPDGLEGDLVDRVAVVGPGVAESDVRETDAAPGEERGQAGQGEQPVEDLRTAGIEVDVR